jgi:hypothetical protein
VLLFLCAAILLGVFVYRNLHQSELVSFRDKLGLLCHERAQALRGAMGQSIQSMQGAAGFGRLSDRFRFGGGAQVPVGTGAFPINTNVTACCIDGVQECCGLISATIQATEAVAYRSRAPVASMLKDSDFKDFFSASAAPRFIQQILWMPLVRNDSRADWSRDTGITIKYSPTGVGFAEQQWNKEIYWPWHYLLLDRADFPDFVGLDMNVIPSVIQDMNSSISTGQVWFSFRTAQTNVDSTGRAQYGLYVVLPVFRHQSAASASADTFTILEGLSLSEATNASARWDDTIGTVFASVRMFSVMQSMLSSVEEYPMSIDLFDLSPPTPDMAFITGVSPVDNPVESEALSDSFLFSNHRFALRCTPSYDWLQTAYSQTPLYMSLGAAGIVVVNLMLLLALAFFWGWHREMHRSRELEEADRQRAASLREKAEAQRISEAANQSKTEFLGFLCHELRNPLHAIGSMMEFLHSSESLQARAEHDDLECLDTIDSQVKLMNVLGMD